jgi:hypothetical protein
MRLLGISLVTLMLVGACAALKQTESLPSPSGAQGIPPGPEGEGDYNYSNY